jgi:hypothetical protein
MPVTYYSSTGAISFAPVAPRDQAVGPIEVAVSPSPPDEIIEPQHDNDPQRFHRSPTVLAIAALTTIAALTFVGPDILAGL